MLHIAGRDTSAIHTLAGDLDREHYAACSSLYSYTLDGKGNQLHYYYDTTGRLQSIDPLGRTTTFSYSATGFTVKDWRQQARAVTYATDTHGRLTTVDLPQTDTGRPQYKYEYTPSATDATDATYPMQLELETNLRSIMEPNQAALSDRGLKRVTYDYGTSSTDDNRYDYVQRETWTGAFGETATFQYDKAAGKTTSTDVLGQVREYTFTAPAATDYVQLFSGDRPHIATLTEQDVPVFSVPLGHTRQRHRVRSVHVRRSAAAHKTESLRRRQSPQCHLRDPVRRQLHDPASVR